MKLVHVLVQKLVGVQQAVRAVEEGVLQHDERRELPQQRPRGGPRGHGRGEPPVGEVVVVAECEGHPYITVKS